ncbi:ribonuclease H-like domain-containing protein [Tanacetum coccineum]
MTGNKAYLVEYQDYNGGPIGFGGSKGYISGKGKIKTRKLDFEDVCFVKELQHFNLFSVSRMCDKKNKVLFTDTECLVLSPDFKLPNENQVLLRVPRQNNMYNFNLENIVPTRGLACLIAKATVDKSNKWHKRLGHVNFKNLNKLMKGNLVRGLPLKIFQNDHTCVACQKGKQHKASCLNRDIIEFCGSKGIKREYSNARTTQQNGVAERKNMTLIEPLPKIDPKNKGKGVLEEEPKPVKVKSKDQGEAQIERNVEIALTVQVELDEEARLERQRQEQASLNYIANLYDEVQERIDANHELAIRRTQEEQEKYTVDERVTLLVEYFENRKKQLAEERAAAIKNKPLTKSQLRSLMMTTLNIQEDERLIQKMNKKVDGVHEEKVLEEPDSTKVEVKQEGNKESTRKRPGKRLKMKATKKSRMQKTDSDLEEEEHLNTFLKLVPDEEGIIDYEVMEKRFPIINWESKFYHLDRHGAECIYYRIFRSDESSRWIKTFSEMVKMFDRLDLEELYNLVIGNYEFLT